MALLRLEGDAPVSPWEPVDLPHSPFISDLDGREHWLGLCRYRRQLEVDARWAGQRCFLQFGAAMQRRGGGSTAGRSFITRADIFRSKSMCRRFSLTLRASTPSSSNWTTVGIPTSRRARNWMSSTPAGMADCTATHGCGLPDLAHHGSRGSSGGDGRRRLRPTLEASQAQAVVRVRTHVRNAGPERRKFQLEIRLHDAEGREVAGRWSPRSILRPARAAILNAT